MELVDLNFEAQQTNTMPVTSGNMNLVTTVSILFTSPYNPTLHLDMFNKSDMRYAPMLTSTASPASTVSSSLTRSHIKSILLWPTWNLTNKKKKKDEENEMMEKS